MARRKKSAATIQKNVEEMKQKLLQLEDELEAAKEAKYEIVGRCFADAFYNCVDFDLIQMSETEIQRFMRSVRRYYEIYRMEQQEIVGLDDEIDLQAASVL